MPKVLTSAAVKKFSSSSKRREIRDGGARGLYLVISPNGTKSWALRFRKPGGQQTRLVLGSVDLSDRELPGDPVLGMPLTLAAARQVAAVVHRDREKGRDVVADRRAERHRRRAEIEESAGNSYAALARKFVDEHARKRTRRWPETARLLGLRYPRDGGEPEVVRGGLADRWRDRPVSEIDAGEVWALIDEVRKSGAPGLERRADGPTDSRARAMLSALSTFLGWCVRHRKIAANPCVGIARPPAPPSRDRVLTDREMVGFWKACDAVGEPFDAALRLLLVTGCRLNEVGAMRRAELSEDGATWTIPGERTKNGRTHVVPLPPLARETVASVRRVAGERGFLFTTNGKTPVSGWSKIKRRLDKEMGNPPPWRLHDLRRTAVTQMAELGIRPDVIELCVNHVSGHRGGVAGVYNRSELMPERRAALERWSEHLRGLVSGKAAKVVSLRGKGRT